MRVATAQRPAAAGYGSRHYRPRLLTLTAVLLALLVTVTPYSHALQQGASADSAPTVHGTIINSVTHQPIARALVTCASESMLTDNEGRFSFTLEPTAGTPFTLMMQARRPGYFAPSGSQFATANVMVPASSVEVTLALTPASAIVGALTLPGDDAADGLQVQLLHREIRNGRARWATFRYTQATSEGRFRFGGLAAGTYLVHVGASLDPAPAQSERIRSGYMPVFYPSARELSAAGVLTVSAGQQVEAKMALTREPFYPVAIPVAGETTRGINFEISSDTLLGLQARFSPQDGMVHMELPSGHYRLEGHGFGPTPLTGQREFDVNAAPLRGPAITLTPTGRIPVTVHADLSHTRQAPPEQGRALTAAGQVGIDLQSDSASAGGRGGRVSFQDDASSGQTAISYLTGATPGRYWLNPHAYTGYVVTATSGGVDLLEEPLVIGADGSAAPISISVRDDVATLAVTLGGSLLQATGAAAAGTGVPAQVYLYLVPRSGAGEYRSDAFDLNGTLELSSLAPGSYLAFAATVQQQIEYRNPKVMASLGRQARAVTLQPGGSESVTLDSLADLSALAGGGAP